MFTIFTQSKQLLNRFFSSISSVQYQSKHQKTHQKSYQIDIYVQRIMDYKRIYEDIVKNDPKIRLVTICDLNGNIMYSEHRQGVKNLLTPEDW